MTSPVETVDTPNTGRLKWNSADQDFEIRLDNIETGLQRKVLVLSVAPTDPTLVNEYIDQATGVHKYWNGATWVNVSADPTAHGHPASVITIVDAGNNYAATQVETALAEEADARQAHEAQATDAHDASAISVLDTGNNFAAVNVETALAEEADARQAHEADTADAHDASAISLLDSGANYAATDVEAALAEEADARQAHEAAADPHGQYQKESEKGAANGYAGLDAGSKVPVAQLPDTVVGAMDYQGTWNASTNTPALSDAGVGRTKGDYYKVSTAGATNLAGITDWKIGDWAVWNGSAWDKIDNTESVPTVFGRTGAVVAASGDYNAGQVSYTPSGDLIATNVQAAVDELQAEKKSLELEALPDNFANGAASITTYPIGDSVMRVTTASTGWPVAATGYAVVTNRTVSGTEGHQEAQTLTGVARYWRRWNSSSATWDVWNQFERMQNKGVASGYAGLDASGYVEKAQLGSGSPSATTFLAGNNTWVDPGAAALPTGMVMMWAGATAPSGFAFCNGQLVGRTDPVYAPVFAVIGTAYGGGDGSTTFAMPDMRGRSPIGVGTGDATDATAWTRGQSGGFQTHTLSENQLAPHMHDVHHTISTNTTVGGGSNRVSSISNGGVSAGSNAADTAGGGAAHNNMHPVTGINFIIKL